jgi:hypothetical protein
LNKRKSVITPFFRFASFAGIPTKSSITAEEEEGILVVSK